MRKKFLKLPTQPIEVFPEKGISELTKEMLLTGFQGRKLAEAIEVWARMLRRKQIVIWFGLAGAMVPAGMRKIISYLIRRRMIDVLVSTGANLYHDFCEAIGIKHFVGTPEVDDVKLRKHAIDRIYDVFADEKKYYKADNIITNEFTLYLKDGYPYSSREILFLLGKFLSKFAKEKDSILVSCYKYGVPIFCPALSDSCIGFSLMFANRRRKDKIIKIRGKPTLLKRRNIIIDQLKDVDESSRITERSKETGIIFIGGGVPRNFIQQTAIIASYQTRREKSHRFAINITTDLPQWGGLSGSSFREAQSWGKLHKRARMVTCHCDATIALPLIVHSLADRFKKLRRNVPIFEWKNGKLKIAYRRIAT